MTLHWDRQEVLQIILPGQANNRFAAIIMEIIDSWTTRWKYFLSEVNSVKTVYFESDGKYIYLLAMLAYDMMNNIYDLIFG